MQNMTDRQKVKSGDDGAADAHERARDYLGQAHIDRLLAAAKKGRHGVRDHLLILMMFRHGLRVSEAIALRRKDVDLAQSRIWITRLKNGLSVEQPIPGDELRAIRRWFAKRDDTLPWLFVSERSQPLTAHSDASGRQFRQHPVSHSGVSGHLRIVAAWAWFLMSGAMAFVNVFGLPDRDLW